MSLHLVGHCGGFGSNLMYASHVAERAIVVVGPSRLQSMMYTDPRGKTIPWELKAHRGRYPQVRSEAADKRT